MEASIFALEHSFLKVPHEQVCKTSRAAVQLIDAEVELITTRLKQVVGQSSVTRPTVVAREIDGLMKQLLELKEKINGLAEVEKHLLDTAADRIEHLKSGLAAGDAGPEVELWKQQRLDRIICDHLLRVGHYDIAEKLAGLARIERFTNLDIFRTSKQVEDALASKDCGPALKWCAANHTRLDKLKSTLEFKLHLQNFLQLVTASNRDGAITYAREHFAAHAERHLDDIRAAMALLVFRRRGVAHVHAKHAELLAEERWDALVQQFRRNIFAVHSLSGQSALDVTLQSGLSVLKNYGCVQDGECNPDCPSCDAHMRSLAEKLPFAHHENSRLVCRMSGDRMNEDNPPMALPNGNVYGRNALEAMAAETGGVITCPRSHKEFPFSAAQKVFIM